MASKYLAKLSADDYKALSIKLSSIQSGICFICQSSVDFDIQEMNIDHIIPLANKGKDWLFPISRGRH
jgi:5-methylcytosine-specific restriction endonuclease McrA